MIGNSENEIYSTRKLSDCTFLNRHAWQRQSSKIRVPFSGICHPCLLTSICLAVLVLVVFYSLWNFHYRSWDNTVCRTIALLCVESKLDFDFFLFSWFVVVFIAFYFVFLCYYKKVYKMSKLSVLAFHIWSYRLPGKIYEKSVESKVNIEFLDRVFLI